MSSTTPSQPSAHRLTVLADDHVHGPMTPGRLEVLHVRRVMMSTAATERMQGPDRHAIVISVSGSTGSKSSTACKALITFLRNAQELPKPVFDVEHACINLYYPIADLPQVMGILKSRKNRFCYFWQTSDRQRTLAWLLAMA